MGSTILDKELVFTKSRLRQAYSRGRLPIATATAVAMVTGGVAVSALAAEPPTLSGSCTVPGAVLPCSASIGQTYAGATIGPADTRAAVQGVLLKLLGPPVEVLALTKPLTGSTHDMRFTPPDIAGVQRFSWAYVGPAQNLAYISVHSAGGFAVIGVAGLRAGTVDVSTLLGGQPVAGVQLWTTLYSKADPIVASALHGAGFVGNVRLGKIENGTVGCLHAETAVVARCVFTPQSGAWAETPTGSYARVGQPVTLAGKPGGDYVTAARINPDGTVPALAPTGHDSAGQVSVASGEELGGYAVAVETLGSARNAFGRPLENFVTREVCIGDAVHPDGATQTRSYPVGDKTAYCYTGRGAALNDPNGRERDQYGVYFWGGNVAWWEHHAWYNGYEVPAAKRPATSGYPQKVSVTSALLWRALASGVSIAN